MEIEPVNPASTPPERSESTESLPPAPITPEEDIADSEEVQDDNLGDNVDLMA